ncbi:MAG: DNA primase [bacterium]
MPIFNYLKNTLSIVDIISEYVSLKIAGNYHKGPCPFHHEKEASFTVSPDRGIFYCFGCHASGDLISFIEKKENLSPSEAIKYLIDKYQLEVPEEIKQNFSQVDTSLKNSFFESCKLFSDWANNKLSENEIALNYLKKRGIGADLIEYFKIGYFPGGARNINNLLKLAGTKDLMAKDIIEAGILVQSKSVLYSPFEERIIFPINDILSRCCGFGGRIFRENDERAKYYNSKESIWFQKGKLLFALDKAKSVLQEKKSVFLVEGYTDTVSMVKYGYKNVVATLGTACTADHLKILSRYIDTVFVSYDGDKAGQNAILRLTQLCWDTNLELKIITLPPQDDPASYLEKKGTLDELTSTSRSIFSFFIDIVSKDFPEKSLSDKMMVGKKILQLIAKINDELKQEILLQEASKALDIPISSLKNLVFKEKSKLIEKENDKFYPKPDCPQKKELGGTTNVTSCNESDIPFLEERIFSAIINNIDNTDKLYVPEDLTEYFSEYVKNILRKLNNFIKENENTKTLFNPFLESLNENDRNWVISNSLKFDQKENEQTFNELLVIFSKRYWKQIVKDIKEKMLKAQQKQDAERVNNLFELFSKLKNGIKTRGLI